MPEGTINMAIRKAEAIHERIRYFITLFYPALAKLCNVLVFKPAAVPRAALAAAGSLPHTVVMLGG
jgi:hypothetical protein